MSPLGKLYLNGLFFQTLHIMKGYISSCNDRPCRIFLERDFAGAIMLELEFRCTPTLLGESIV